MSGAVTAADTPLVLVAEGGGATGAGHLMRCLALAEAWQEAGGEARFLVPRTAESLLHPVRARGMRVTTVEFDLASEPDRLAQAVKAEARSDARAWAVLDGYGFTVRTQRAVRETGTRLLVIDDNGHLPGYDADVILNQNVHADSVSYAAPGARVLRGLDWALIRSEYRLARASTSGRSAPARARSVLVTMGGSDPADAATLTLDALDRLPEHKLRVVLVVGPANPRFEALERRAALSVHDVVALRSPDLPTLMTGSDMAISAAGSTCWELACLGVPSVVLATAGNQRDAAVVMGRTFAVHAGDVADLDAAALAGHIGRLRDDAALRARLSSAGSALVDGEGAGRVVNILLSGTRDE